MKYLCKILLSRILLLVLIFVFDCAFINLFYHCPCATICSSMKLTLNQFQMIAIFADSFVFEESSVGEILISYSRITIVPFLKNRWWTKVLSVSVPCLFV